MKIHKHFVCSCSPWALEEWTRVESVTCPRFPDCPGCMLMLLNAIEKKTGVGEYNRGNCYDFIGILIWIAMWVIQDWSSGERNNLKINRTKHEYVVRL